MHRNRRPRGSAAVGWIIAIVVVLIVGGGIAYYVSDPIRTKTDAAVEGWTKWTPENIAKDPVNYLNFAEAETKKAQDKLKASEIAIAQKRAKLEGMKEEADNKIKVGEKALTELKTKYKAASEGGAWPIQFNGADRDEAWTKQQIMSFHRQVESKKSLSSKVDAGIKKLDAQKVKVIEERAKCEEQLAKIATNREMLKVQEITDDLKSQLVEMRGVLETTVASAGEDTGTMSLDDLADSQVGTVDDAEFLKVLNE